MSPEERAESVREMLERQWCQADDPPRQRALDCPSCFDQHVSEAISAAEDEALERAAALCVAASKALDGVTPYDRGVIAGAITLAGRIRSLKSPSPRGGEGEPTP